MPRNNMLAYEDVARQGLEGRELEATVLLKAAQKLRLSTVAWKNSSDARSKDAVNEALRYNQRLWTVLQTDLSDPAHPLPAE